MASIKEKDNAHWTAELEQLLPRPCRHRPFVCDGFPDQQEVIVIGENPATVTATDCWTFWDGQTGFNRASFMETYRAKRPTLRGTRARMERMLEVHSLRVLETNVAANEKIDGAGSNATDNGAVLSFLLENSPSHRAVIVHGEKGQRGRSKASYKDTHTSSIANTYHAWDMTNWTNCAAIG